MMHVLKTKIVRLYEPGEPPTGSAGQILTSRGFMLKNGLWLQVHQFEPITLAAIWDLPRPGETVQRWRLRRVDKYYRTK